MATERHGEQVQIIIVYFSFFFFYSPFESQSIDWFSRGEGKEEKKFKNKIK